MKEIQLKPVENSVKIGDNVPNLEPTLTEDAYLMDGDDVVGLYLRDMGKRASQLLSVANKEFMSDRVKKTLMERKSDIADRWAKGEWQRQRYWSKGVSQMATLIGSIPPKGLVRRHYAKRSAIHLSDTAKTYVKAMLLLVGEVERIMEERMSKQYRLQKKQLGRCGDKWRLGDLFTSGISNYNVAARYHRDVANWDECVNVIMTKRHNAKGGNLSIPDHDVVADQCDGSMLIYPAWSNVHGVTPIEPIREDGYRNTHVLYCLKAFDGLISPMLKL